MQDKTEIIESRRESSSDGEDHQQYELKGHPGMARCRESGRERERDYGATLFENGKQKSKGMGKWKKKRPSSEYTRKIIFKNTTKN